MYHDDHPPAHIHIEYQGCTALVEIKAGEIIKGSLPNKVHKIVKEWVFERQDELMRDWELAQNFEPLEKIKGADND
jgi:predicted lipid-binding transport protein (Tim44 family)